MSIKIYNYTSFRVGFKKFDLIANDCKWPILCKYYIYNILKFGNVIYYMYKFI